MRKPTIYIAGPMRGHDNWNFDSFDRQAKLLRQNGWQVINPAELERNLQKKYGEMHPHEFNPDSNQSDQEFLRKALQQDMTEICTNCTALYMLSGWEKSKGAIAERSLAQALGLDIFYEIPNMSQIGKLM